MNQDQSQSQKSRQKLKDYGILFQGITPLIRKIRQNENNVNYKLENKDIQEFVPESANIDGLFKNLDAYLKIKRKQQIHLFEVLRINTGKIFAQVCFYNFLSRMLSLTGVEFLDRITTALSDIEKSNTEEDAYYHKQLLSIYFACLVLTFTLKTVFINHSLWKRNIWITTCQAVCQYLLFRKAMTTLSLSQEQLVENDSSQNKEKTQIQEKNQNNDKNQKSKEEKVEEEDEDIGADVYNLMSTDSAELGAFAWGFNETIISLVYIVVILYQISIRLGNLILKGIYVILAGFVVNILIVGVMISLFSAVMSYTDKRVSLSTDVIEGIKSIKYLSWERIFEQKIMQARNPEFQRYSIIRISDGILGVFWGCISYVFLYYFLTRYVADGHELKDTNVFTLIALFNLFTYPLGILPWSIGETFRALIHYKRIRDFLLIKDINKNSVFHGKDGISTTDQNKKTGEYDETGQRILNNSSSAFMGEQSKDNETALEISALSFVWPRIDQELKQIQDGVDKKNQDKFQKADRENSQTEVQSEQSFSDNENMKEKLILKEGRDAQAFNPLTENKMAFILSINNFKIQKGALKFIVGRIGSGKSALLQAILNEMETLDLKDTNNKGDQNLDRSRADNNDSLMSSNMSNIKMQSHIGELSSKKVFISGSIGYVSQNHWLQNQTIKDNILFGKEYQKQFYDRCIEMCELQTDFSVFPQGDQKLISPGGNNLSGGQRQRICLCRAIYQENDIYLFDDIFSSLDAHVADSIFEQCIKKYLIEEKKTTVLLVTSHYQYLENIDQDDIVLFEHGKIVYDVVKKKKFMDTLLESEQKNEKQQSTQLSEEQNGEITFDALPPLQKQQSSRQQKLSSQEQSKLQEGGLEKQDDKLLEEDDEEEDDQNEEKRDKGKIKSITLKSYFQSMGLVSFGFYIFFTFMMRGSRSFIDFWIRNEVETEQIQIFEKIHTYFGGFQQAFRIMMFLNLGMTFIRAVFYALCSISASRIMFNKLNNFIIYAKMKFFDENPPGRIIARIGQDIATIDDPLPWIVHVVLWDFVDSIIVPFGIIIQFPYMSVFFLITIFIIYKIQAFFRPANREIKRLTEINNAQVLTTLNETCSGVMTIRAHQKESIFLEQCILKMQDSISATIASYGAGSWSQSTLMLIANLLLFALGALCVSFTWLDVGLEPNMMAMTISYTVLLTDIFNDLVWELSDAEKHFISVERIRQFLDNTPQNLDHIENSGVQNNKTVAKSDTQEDFKNISVSFKNVTLTYDDDTVKESDRHYALKNLNIDIQKGEKVAFCGRTGSGKTSILNVIFNLYPIKQGSIYINGKQQKEMSLQELRTQMSIIPQFGFLYNASLKDNLDPEQKFKEDVIAETLSKTELFISKVHKQETVGADNLDNEQSQHDGDATIIQVEEDNNKDRGKSDLNMTVEKSGSNLSNGEKQIVNFLRIIFRETEIICIDEATSNMDPKTDAKLHEKLFEFAKGQTLLVITHRLENIDQFDRVIVLEKGEIVQSGHVSELRQIEGGYFNKLIKLS